MTATRRAPDLARCADQVVAHFAPLAADLADLAERIVAGIGGSGIPGPGIPVPPTPASRLDELVRPTATRLVDRHRILGAGFAAGHGTVADSDLHLAWWERGGGQSLDAPVAPATGDGLDYTRQEWFRGPIRTGRRHLTGPYIGYLLGAEFVMTTSVPVLSGATPLGVVGADTLVEDLEKLLAPALTAADAVLVTDEGRCVTAADPALPSGRRVDVAAYPAALRCDDLPLTVLA